MIEEIVPRVVPGGLASPTVVDSNLDNRLLAQPRSGTPPTGVSFQLPEGTLEELQWVADQEGCEVSELVLSAVEEFLSDHWVRNADV